MAYTINRYDGEVITQVIDSTINNVTDLKFVGRNYAGYGEIQNENFLYLLENFSGEIEPPNKIRGQLWFDTLEQKIKIYTGQRWKSLGFIQNSDQEPIQFEGEVWNDTVNKKLNFYDGSTHRTLAVTQNSAEEPDNLKQGDFWWNTESSQLFVYNGQDYELIGPTKAGDKPTLMVSELVKDTQGQNQAIIKSVVDGSNVFVISENEFRLSQETPIEGFDFLKKGITLKDAESGVSQNNNIWFWGTASDAGLLDGLNSQQFLRSDIDTQSAGNIEFSIDNKGIVWDSKISIKNQGTDLNFVTQENSSFDFSYLSGEGEVSLLKIDTDNGIDGLSFRGGTVWNSKNDGPGTGLNADLLDGLEGSFYLNWNNTVNKPSPQIDFFGDATGSGVLTQLTSSQINLTVQKDSHRHTISTIDNLQSALDSKLNASQYTAEDVFNKVKNQAGSGSGLNADLLNGLPASEFLRLNGKAVDSEKLDGLDSSVFLQKSGGNMSGDINFTQNSEGIVWSRNTDGASIKFHNRSDSDTETRLEFQTRDNTNEYFLWTHKPTGSNSAIELMRLAPNDTVSGLTFRNNIVWHSGNDGSGSNLDADTLDGKHAADFLGRDAKAINADNADKLDGFDANYFMPINGGTFSGFVSLFSEPQQSNHAATKNYVDSQLEEVGQPGQVGYFATSSAPNGWLKANGAEVSRSTYSRLFDTIGTRFGAGNGSTTFNLPDLRGEFIRGWDNGRGIDPGRSFGSSQSGELESHSHSMSSSGRHSHSASTNTAGRHTHTLVGNNRGTYSGQESAPGLYVDDAERAADDPGTIQAAGDHSHTVYVNSAGEHSHSIRSTGGSETRPRNIALLACIKY